MNKPKLNEPDVEQSTTGGYSTPLSEYYQQMAFNPNAIPKYAQITNQDLFIIIRAILWCLPQITILPEDTYIMGLIEANRNKYKEIIQNNEVTNNE